VFPAQPHQNDQRLAQIAQQSRPVPQPVAPGGVPGAQQMHPELARNLNPTDPVQTSLLQNINKLQPQEVEVLRQAFTASPQLAAIMSKIAPCVAFVFQKLAQGQQGAPIAGKDQPGADAEQLSGSSGAALTLAPGAPLPPQQPTTQLGRM
jgi:hypothetical protein